MTLLPVPLPPDSDNKGPYCQPSPRHTPSPSNNDDEDPYCPSSRPPSLLDCDNEDPYCHHHTPSPSNNDNEAGQEAGIVGQEA